jgi:Tfp pilus assembly protein PilO
MRSNERTIIVAVAIVALAAAFYLMVLGPKREKASELTSQIDQLNGSISAAEQQASYGEQARQEFPKYYGRMVVLGKAVPGEADTASLLVQLNGIADQSKMDLRAIALNQGGATAATTAPAPTPAPAAPSTGSAPTAAASTAASTASSASTAGSTTPTTASTPAPSPTAAATPAPATEATAAALPVGSVVGPAGLPTLPYTVTLSGTYFDVSNFIGGVDGLVKPVADGTQLSPDGRLLTVNGFSLQVTGAGSSPKLKASFVVTAYSSGDLGLTAGASSSGPAPVSPGETSVQQASAVVAK